MNKNIFQISKLFCISTLLCFSLPTIAEECTEEQKANMLKLGIALDKTQQNCTKNTTNTTDTSKLPVININQEQKQNKEHTFAAAPTINIGYQPKRFFWNFGINKHFFKPNDAYKGSNINVCTIALEGDFNKGALGNRFVDNGVNTHGSGLYLDSTYHNYAGLSAKDRCATYLNANNKELKMKDFPGMSMTLGYSWESLIH